MINKIKQLDRKYLMMLGILGGGLLIVIIIIVVIAIIAGRNLSYEKIEDKLISAAQEYIAAGEVDAPAPGTSIKITSDELVNAEYLKELTEYRDNDVCSGSVTVMNNGGLALYLPDLQCKEYMTQHLSAKIIDDHLVTETIVDGAYQFGLYSVDNEYIFRGKDVNNYVSFGGVTWRIIKIDGNGNLRLIKSTSEEDEIPWDEKFNPDINDSYGINDYPNSYLAETLNKDYEGFNDSNKKHLIPHDVCIGSRAQMDTGISYDFDCSKILEKQYISTLTTLDVPMASLDPDCTTVISGSCTNYNYMASIRAWTVNNYADNTYEAFGVSGTVGKSKTNRYSDYYWVVYVSGTELYKGGSGTAADPYIIGE